MQSPSQQSKTRAEVQQKQAGDPLEDLFHWSLDATTQITLIIFLFVGVAVAIWTLAIRPLLLAFSRRYRAFEGNRVYELLKPTLDAVGVTGEAERLATLKAVWKADTGRPDDVLRRQLLRMMALYLIDRPVRLGRNLSDPLPYFIDLRAAAVDPVHREVLADILANFVSRSVSQRVAKGELKSVKRVIVLKEGNPLVATVAATKLNLPLSVFRGVAFPKFHGSTDPYDSFDGQLNPDDDVILVDDSTFRGTTILSAITALRAAKVNVKGVFLLFRPNNSELGDTLASLAVPLLAIVTITDDVLEQLKSAAESVPTTPVLSGGNG